MIFSLNAQIVETFNDYAAGGKLAQQAHAMGRDYWTTWSEAPGGSEDGVIEVLEGKKCVKLIPNNDQAIRLGNKNGSTWVDKTSGSWELAFKIYIPTGKDGYFNIKSVFPSDVSETWAMQIYMGTTEGSPGPSTPGVGVIFGGSSTGVNFNFAHDEWTLIKILIDLDADLAKFFANDILVHTYQYSKGSFGNSNHKFIAACNIFPPNTAATSLFYITDFSFGVQYNFDDKPNGSYVAQSYQGFWTTWENNPGTAEDALISNEQSQSSPNSAKLNYSGGNGTDLVFVPGNKTNGVYTIDFDLYIPNNGSAFFNLLHIFNGFSSTWAVGIYFNVDASGGPQAGTYIQENAIITPFNLPPFETWFPVSLYVDVDNDIAKISICGNHIHEWQFSVVENPLYGGTPLAQLAAIDFFPPQSGSIFYMDNFKFCVPALVIQEPGGNIFETGFDDVPNGSYVAVKYPEWFTTWDDNPGTKEDALITNTQSSSPPQSAKCDWETDLVFKAGNKTEGIFAIDFDMYIPDGLPAFFNLLQVFNGSSSKWGVGVYFNIPATGGPAGVPQGNSIHNNKKFTPFTAPSNKWFPVSMYVDLDHDVAAATIDGKTVLAWKFSTEEEGGAGIKQLAAADFYPIMASSVFYIDNFEYREADLEALPVIDVTPTAITHTSVEGGDVVSVPVTVSNIGTGQGKYEAIVEGTPWLSLTGDTEANVGAGANKTFNAAINPAELAGGEHTASILVKTTYQEFEIKVNLTITLGIEDYVITTIFPNPASNFISVVCSTMINSIQMLNSVGQIVYNASVNDDKTTVDISNLSAGYYFIRVITNEGVNTTKVVIQ
jgi:hypothetical protein